MGELKPWQYVAIAAVGALLYHVFVVAGWQAESKRSLAVLQELYESEVDTGDVTSGASYEVCDRASSAARNAGVFADTPGAGWFWDWWFYDCGWTERTVAPNG